MGYKTAKRKKMIAKIRYEDGWSIIIKGYGLRIEIRRWRK